MMVLHGMASSLRAIVWVLVLVCIIVYSFGIICVDLIGKEESGYPDRDTDVEELYFDTVSGFNNYLYFGSLSRSMLSLINVILLDEWTDIIRPVLEVQAYMALSIFCLVLFTTFGVFNVVIGVVVQRMMEAMEAVRQESVEEEHEERKRLAEQLAEVMTTLDIDCDGRLSPEEFQQGFENDQLRRLMDGFA